MKKKFNFLGVCMDAVTYPEIFEKVDLWCQNKEDRSRHIACLNAYCVTLASRDSRLKQIYNGADIAGPDGMPFVRWIRAFGKAPCDRIDGSNILLQLADRAKETGYTFYLYGGAPDVVENMKRYFEERFPHIRIVGYLSPPFRPLTDEEDLEICNEINRLKPDIICVGLGTPKQDYWIEEHIDRIRGAVFLAIGAAFDFFGGRVKMAPDFIRNSGFEWFYRLVGKDFRRLWYRYTILNLVFLWNFLLQLLGLKYYHGQRLQHSDEKDLRQ